MGSWKGGLRRHRWLQLGSRASICIDAEEKKDPATCHGTPALVHLVDLTEPRVAPPAYLLPCPSRLKRKDASSRIPPEAAQTLA